MKRLARHWPLAVSLLLHALAIAALINTFAAGVPPRALSVSLLPAPAAPASQAQSAKAAPARPPVAPSPAQDTAAKPRAVAPPPPTSAAVTRPPPAEAQPAPPGADSAAPASAKLRSLTAAAEDAATTGKAPAATSPGVPAASADGAGTASQGVDWRAALAANPKPVYPERSRMLGEQGRVVLRVRVGTDGRALAVEVLHSSGHPRLDRAAREALRHWRFVPARQDGVAVEDSVDVPIRFAQTD